MEVVLLLLLLACGAEAPPPPAPAAPPPPPLLDRAPPGAQLATYQEMWADRVATRHPADGGGTVTRLDTTVVHAGEPGRFVLRYTAGPQGVAVGGTLTFIPEPFWGWSAPQTRAPDRHGFVTTAAPDGVTLVAQEAPGQLVLEVQGRPLAPGEVIDWVYGEGIGARVDRFAEPEAGLYLAVDGDGDGIRAQVLPAATVEVAPGPAVQLHTTLPTTAAVGAPLRLTVAALDAGANAHARGIDTVALTLPDGWRGPAQLPVVDGLAETLLHADTPGVGRVVVRSPEGIEATTNPVVVRDGAPRILWADLQIHTGRSDGTGTPATAYRYARDVAGLDAAAVTDHDRFGMRFLDAEPSLWREAIDAADTATRGGFVAFPAYEWTNWVFGHRHVLYVGSPGPVFSSLDPATDTPPELWQALRDHDAITIAHHPAGGPVPVDWSFPPDPALEPVVEVVSVHGQSESPSLPSPIYDARGDGWVEGVLRREGVRLGLIGSTDGHDGHPGLAHLVGQGSGGLAALVDAAPTREGIAEALRARRVYATNGVRPFVRFEADGAPMGSVRPAGDATLVLRVVGTAPIVGAELVGRQGPLERVAGDGSAVLFHTFHTAPAPGDLRYVRIVQADGGLAWTSPFYFEAP